MAHSAILTLIAFAISIAYCFGFGLPVGALALITFVGVCFIGLPHGGLDYQLGTQWLRERVKPHSHSKHWMMGLFLAVYLAIATSVIVGWYLLPLLTVTVFFGLAGWHFGLEEEPTAQTFKGLDQWGIAARGSMVIWCTSLFRPTEVSQILEQTLPTSLITGSQLVSVILACLPVLLFLLAWDLIRIGRQVSKPTLIAHLIRLLSFAVMFGVCPVLLSFAVYFCGWHSIRGFAHLREQTGGSSRNLATQLAPTSIAAILFFVGGFLFYQSQLASSAAAIRTIFIGLSAVAIPHLLLHVAIDRSAFKSGHDFLLDDAPRVQEAAAC